MAEPSGYAYDVYISHSSVDRPWVCGELLPYLERAGLRTCVDFRDFKAGTSRVNEIERALLTSHRTLLVLTPDYLEDEWAGLVSSMAQALDLVSQDYRLIPLLKLECDLPLRIRHLNYVDLADPDNRDIAWTQLIAALGKPPIHESPPKPTYREWYLAHFYPMPPHFTGRAAEREMLTRWLHTDHTHPLLVLRALGGFGKSALAWHWLLHDVSPARWPHVIWWSFYDEREFTVFLRDTLEYLGVAPGNLAPRQQIDTLLGRLRLPGPLLVLDGFERALRAYGTMNAPYQGDEPLQRSLEDGRDQGESETGRDCISPLAEHFLRGVSTLPDLLGKVFMTTRLRPRALEAPGGALLLGCREEELTELHPTDAVDFFRARGVRGARAEIERACAPYGYHPLSLSLLAGLILTDSRRPGDVVAADRLDLHGDLVQRQHHVLARAYETLASSHQRLLSRIACFRGPVAYDALCAVGAQAGGFETSKALDVALRDLVARGLLHHDQRAGRYDLHPIVRRYAYDRLGDPERTAAHTQLRDYFAAVPAPDRVLCLEDLNSIIELYHHTIRAGQYDEAVTLFRDRLEQSTHFRFGAYQLRIELLCALFPDGEDKPPRFKGEDAQGWILTALANSYSLSGQPRQAMPLFEQDIAICEKRGDKRNLAIGLGNLASMAQIHTGALQAAEVNLRRMVALCQEIDDKSWEAVGRQVLGQLLTYRGVWDEAEKELNRAQEVFDLLGVTRTNFVSVVRAYCAFLELLRKNTNSAKIMAQQALELAQAEGRSIYGGERDIVRAHWLLGAAYRTNGNLLDADRHLTEAVTRCRAVNMVYFEAYILLDLARLRAQISSSLTGSSSPSKGGDRGEEDLVEAKTLAHEALTITERSGYVLQGADVHLFLSELSLQGGDRNAALHHAQEARRLAYCDGPPDYMYKVAYEEAGALLAQLDTWDL